MILKLEKLKGEAAEVNGKFLSGDEEMKQVEETSSLYTPLAKMASAIYFAAERMSEVSFLYQFSLDFFLSSF